MFRKPRHESSTAATPILPSTGRPPTPPSSSTCNRNSMNNQMAVKTPLPLLGRSQTTPRSTGRQSTTLLKHKGKTNSSILSFFKKTESPLKFDKGTEPKDDGLFLQDVEKQSFEELSQIPTPPRENEIIEFSDEDSCRYNENIGAVKRRRMSIGNVMISELSEVKHALNSNGEIGEISRRTATSGVTATTPSSMPRSVQSEATENATLLTNGHSVPRHSGPSPFIEDDESEDKITERLVKELFCKNQNSPVAKSILSPTSKKHDPEAMIPEYIPEVPSLKREPTSMIAPDAFDGIEDFIDDEFPEDGEEYMERRWMDNQERLELGLEEADVDDDYFVEENGKPVDCSLNKVSESQAGSCPICNASLEGITPDVGSLLISLFDPSLTSARQLPSMLTVV